MKNKIIFILTMILIVAISILTLVLVRSAILEPTASNETIYLSFWVIVALSAVIYKIKYKKKDDRERERYKIMKNQMREKRLDSKK